MRSTLPALLLAFALAASTWAGEVATCDRADGYRGIWFTLGQFQTEYGDKYSGGLGTYTAKHVPLAVYAPKAEKTFFVYGGTTAPGARHLLAMVSYYDHRRGVVPRPAIVHDKGGVADPHDNPSLALDEAGHVWVFVSGRGNHRPGFIYRSAEPYRIDRFERVREEARMAYPQPWWMAGRGFLHCFTQYTKGRELYFRTSPDGRTWGAIAKLAGFGGHYQVTCRRGSRLATAFNWHPGGNVDKRTNLYYLETSDVGRTWRTAAGEAVALPLGAARNPARIRDFQRDGRNVYLKDIRFDSGGRPVILVVTSGGHKPGPAAGPRAWTIAHWTGGAWAFHEVTTSDHNYDMGSLYIEAGGTWRIIGPTETGPQPHTTGGEVAMWTSADRGATWKNVRQLTRNSEYNHTYVRRPVDAHPDFYAFWADGHGREMSPSRLYFTNRAGDHVWRLPATMTEEFAKPEVAW